MKTQGIIPEFKEGKTPGHSYTFFFCFLLKLHCADEDLIDGVVSIFKAVIFKCYSSGSSDTDTRLMDSVLPLLLRLLDERDATARAVVMLIADYCSVYFFFLFFLSSNTLWQKQIYSVFWFKISLY